MFICSTFIIAVFGRVSRAVNQGFFIRNLNYKTFKQINITTKLYERILKRIIPLVDFLKKISDMKKVVDS